jgi:serine/threonine-protein kinase
VKQDSSDDHPAPPEGALPSPKGWVEGPVSEELSGASRRGWVEGPASGELTFDPDGGVEPGMYSTTAISLDRSSGEATQEIPAGTLLASKYRAVRVIGKGGMGIVVEARHEQLDTRVAIKVLLREFMAYPEASSRFLREARAASRLESQHVARVLDVGTLDSGEPFMVMEYLAGQDLSYHLRSQGALVLEDVIDYVVQASDAIAEAHTLGIVHRDLKPANLFFTRRGDMPVIKVLDFGVSKVADESPGEMTLTQTTTILGSALYMSPEQMQSAKKVDRRTDVYALGVCLFELLARELPYFADTFPELCAKIFTQPPRSLREIRPDVPEALDAVMEKCLAREPDKRYQSVPEFVQALSPWARPLTRAQMENLFKRFQPALELLPVAAPSKPSDKPAAGANEKNKKGEERSRKPLPFVWFGALVALVAGGACAWMLFRTGTQKPAAADVTAAQPPASAAAPPEAPPMKSSAEIAGGTTPTALATSDAGMDAGKGAGMGAGTDAGKGSKGANAPSSARNPSGGSAAQADKPSEGTVLTPPPPVDLADERCFANMPDGKRVEVPCN